MERVEERELVPVRVLRDEQEEIQELPLEALDVPMRQLLKDYSYRQIPQRWGID